MIREYAAKLKDKWFWIFFGLMVIAFCTGFYCVCNVTMLVGTKEQLLSLPDFFFFLSFGVFAISIALMFVFGIKNKHYVPNKALLIFLGVLFVCNILAVIFFPNDVAYSHYVMREGYKSDLIFSVEGIRRVKSIVQFLIVLSLTFVTLDVLPKIFNYKALLFIVSACCVAVVAAFIIASYFAEFNYCYNYIFTNPNASDIKHHAVHSVFPNGNSFGFIMFLGVVASVMLHHFTKKWWTLLLPIYFVISMFFTFAKLPIFAGSLVYIGYLIVRLILTWKDNPKRNLLIVIIVGGVLVLIGLGLLVFELVTHKISSLLHNFFTYGNFNTFDSRVSIWQNAFDIIKVSNWRVGTGYQIFNDLLYKFNLAWEPILEQNINQTNSAHNGFLELLGNGGVVLLVSFFILFGILIYQSIKIFKDNKDIVLLEWLIILTSLIYTMFESGTIIFAHNFDYALLSVFIWVPIRSIYLERRAV